jgi:protein gp37
LANLSDIEWTEATWNPVAGCTIVSPGCTNCYAMRMAARLQAMGHTKYQGTTRKSGKRHVWTGKVSLDEESLTVPTSWKKPRRIFVNSMADLFHPAVPKTFIKRVWNAMQEAHWHTYQILTKRPDRMAEVLSSKGFAVLPNVWLGTSVENNDHVGRLDHLRRTAAAIRFVSLEPLLGPVDKADLSEIDWVIVGGESGPQARPMDAIWVADIRRACTKANVAFFFKQWGGRNKKAAGRLLQGRTWDEYPATPFLAEA